MKKKIQDFYKEIKDRENDILIELSKKDKKIREELLKIIDREGGKYKKEIDKNPFLYLFDTKFGTDIGEYFEENYMPIIEPEFKRVSNQNYDGILWKKKIEVKVVRNVKLKNGEKNSSLIDRALSLKDGISSISKFAQVKPQEFNYLYGFVVYKDGIEVYIIKSMYIEGNTEITNDKKINLYTQHKGNLIEGQILVSQVKKYKNNKFYVGIIKIENGKFIYYKKDGTIIKY